MAVSTLAARALLWTTILSVANVVYCESDSVASTTSQPTSTSVVESIIPPCFFNVDSVTLVAFSREYPEGVNLNDTSTHITVSPGQRIYVLVHGFISEANNSNFQDLAQALLDQADTPIVFSLDWSDQACTGRVTLLDILAYPQALDNMHEVGGVLARYLLAILKNNNRSPSDVTLIGHSLGAHVSGFAGKDVANMTGEKYGLIIGLDPAAPGFTTEPCENRLCNTDATTVKIAHTSLLGMPQNLGTVDYFFNGGRSQPQCGLDVSCSHSASVEYVTNSLNPDCEFIGTPWKRGSFRSPMPVSECTPDICSIFGIDTSTSTTENSFYVRVSSTAPYCTVELSDE